MKKKYLLLMLVLPLNLFCQVNIDKLTNLYDKGEIEDANILLDEYWTDRITLSDVDKSKLASIGSKIKFEMDDITAMLNLAKSATEYNEKSLVAKLDLIYAKIYSNNLNEILLLVKEISLQNPKNFSINNFQEIIQCHVQEACNKHKITSIKPVAYKEKLYADLKYDTNSAYRYYSESQGNKFSEKEIEDMTNNDPNCKICGKYGHYNVTKAKNDPRIKINNSYYVKSDYSSNKWIRENSSSNTEYFRFEGETTMTRHYSRTSSTMFSGITRTDNYTDTYKKNLDEDKANTKEFLEASNIFFRETMNEGKIGEYYLPKSTNFWSNPRFNFGGKDHYEKDALSISDIQKLSKGFEIKYEGSETVGGYNSDINGFTYIYQFINKSEKHYVFEVLISGTRYFDTKTKNFWAGTIWTNQPYVTVTESENIETSIPLVLSSGQKFKGSEIIGKNKSSDFTLVIRNFYEVDINWLLGLEKAITGNDINLTKTYLVDPKARIFSKILTLNKDRLYTNYLKNYSSKNKNAIKTRIKISDELLFDEDFDSDIIIYIENTLNETVNCKIEAPGFNEEIKLNAFEKKEISRTIKGFKKEKLSVEIIEVKPVEN